VVARGGVEPATYHPTTNHALWASKDNKSTRSCNLLQDLVILTSVDYTSNKSRTCTLSGTQ